MLDRRWKYPLQLAEDIYFRAAKENMDEFIYEARSLYTLMVAKYQSYSFDMDEVKDVVRILDEKIQSTFMHQVLYGIGFPKSSYDWYVNTLVELEKDLLDR